MKATQIFVDVKAMNDIPIGRENKRNRYRVYSFSFLVLS